MADAKLCQVNENLSKEGLAALAPLCCEKAGCSDLDRINLDFTGGKERTLTDSTKASFTDLEVLAELSPTSCKASDQCKYLLVLPHLLLSGAQTALMSWFDNIALDNLASAKLSVWSPSSGRNAHVESEWALRCADLRGGEGETLEEAFETLQPDVVIFNSGLALPLLTRIPTDRPWVPVVIFHEWWGVDKFQKQSQGNSEADIFAEMGLDFQTVQSTLQRCLCVFVSDRQRNMFATSFDLDKDKLFVVHIGIGSPTKPLASSVPEGEKPGQEPLTILSVGVVCPRKNQLMLLNAFLDLVKELRDEPSFKQPLPKLCMVGAIRGRRAYEDEYLVSLEESIQKAGKVAEGLVEIVDAVPEKALGAFYRRSGIFCLPSKEEVTPVVILEAMAHGLPVVSTDVGGVAEQLGLDGVAPDESAVCSPSAPGMMVQVTDQSGLQKALGTLTRSRALCESMGQAGRERAAELSLEQAGESFLCALSAAREEALSHID